MASTFERDEPPSPELNWRLAAEAKTLDEFQRRAHHYVNDPPNRGYLVDAASPAVELDAWAKVIGALRPGPALPPAETMLPRLLGRLVGAASLDGIALDRPLRVVVLNPQTFAQPIVLSAAVRDARALQASLAGTGIVAQAKRGYTLIGSQAAVARVVVVQRRLPAAAARRGVHATLFVAPIWTTFGPQLNATRAAAFASQSTSSPGVAQSYAVLLDELMAGIEECEQLGVDLSADHARPELTLRLDAKRGSALDRAFSAQRPSDFRLLSRMPGSPTQLIGAGTIDFTSLQGLVTAWMSAGASASDAQQLKSLLDDFARVFNGDFAMMGTGKPGEPGRMKFEYLAGVRDARRAADWFPRWYALFNRMGLFGGAAKVNQKPIASQPYDGVNVSRTAIEYDFSGVQGYKGPTHVTGTSAYAAFDDLFAMASDTLGNSDGIRGLLDSARQGKDTYHADGAAAAALDEARAARDSFWMWMDLATVTAATPTPWPRGSGVSLAVGFAPARARLRLAVTLQAAPR